jgi:hypothetical protein
MNILRSWSQYVSHQDSKEPLKITTDLAWALVSSWLEYVGLMFSFGLKLKVPEDMIGPVTLDLTSAALRHCSAAF